MVKRKRKKIQKKTTYVFEKKLSKKDKKKETKIFWIVMAILLIGSVSLNPGFWIESGKFLWALVPLILIGLFYGAMGGAAENKSFDKGVFFMFMGIFALGILLGFLFNPP